MIGGLYDGPTFWGHCGKKNFIASKREKLYEKIDILIADFLFFFLSSYGVQKKGD